jgi:hypothetical protein
MEREWWCKRPTPFSVGMVLCSTESGVRWRKMWHTRQEHSVKCMVDSKLCDGAGQGLVRRSTELNIYFNGIDNMFVLHTLHDGMVFSALFQCVILNKCTVSVPCAIMCMSTCNKIGRVNLSRDPHTA